MNEALKDVLAGAMRLLATREHSQQELRRKLRQKGHADDLVEEAIAQLAVQNLQSETRFVENFINSHRERGQGPQRIRRELQQHNIDATLIDDYLDANNTAWLEKAMQVRQKKFGDEIPDELKERLRQVRFLEYRGFTHEQINRVLCETDFID